MLGMSISVLKNIYAQRAKESSRKRTATAYTYCFNVIFDWILRDIRIGRAVWEEGVSLVLETGNRHNGEVERHFHNLRREHHLENVMKSICFVPKDDCRAIQMADLFAYYSRRDSGAMEKAIREGRQHKPETMMKIIAERGQFRGHVATDFDRGSRFLAGPLE